MKKIKLPIITIITIIVSAHFFACSHTNRGSEQMQYVYNRPSIEVKNDSIPIKLDLFGGPFIDFYKNVDSIEVIRLETINESLIGNISRTYIVNDTLFVADYHKTKSIFAFDLQGHFLYKINKVGNGPGEYQNINMVQIDEYKIALLDWFSWKIIEYDHVGNFLFEQKVEPNPHDFIRFGQDKMLFSYHTYNDRSHFKLVFTDTNLKAIATAFPFSNTRDVSSDELSYFQKIDEQNVLYHFDFCDTIYQINDKQEIRAKYALSLYKEKELDTFLEKTKDLDLNSYIKEINKSTFVIDYSFFELEDVLYINYTKEKKSYVSLISKKDYRSYNSIISDGVKRVANYPLNVNGYFRNTLLNSFDQVIFDILSKENIELFCKHIKNPEGVKAIKELENSDNNPVVCIIYIKKI